jgi:hypothetical protein
MSSDPVNALVERRFRVSTAEPANSQVFPSELLSVPPDLTATDTAAHFKNASKAGIQDILGTLCVIGQSDGTCLCQYQTTKH